MAAKPSIVRLLTLGDSGAGKSSLLLQYTQGEFTHEYMPTIGIDFRLKTIEMNGKQIKVQVWDTAGQERFRTITHNYYRGAHGIALVYDVTNEQSFQNIRKWIQDVHTYAESNVSIVLIGNKCDLESKKVCFVPLRVCGSPAASAGGGGVSRARAGGGVLNTLLPDERQSRH